MWERSQVEQLTGLSRHMIQDLCYQDTKRGGLAFWEPAVSKPGYSRFDEGDLLMFFLVGQLKRAGFTLAEVEATVFDILEEDGALTSTLRKKAHALHERRAGLDGQLTALECLEDAAAAEPSERLYAVMASVLAQSVDRAIAAAADHLDEPTAHAGVSTSRAVHPAGPAEHAGVLRAGAVKRVRARFLTIVNALVTALQGEGGREGRLINAAGGSASIDEGLCAIAAAIRELVTDDCGPTCPAARRVVMSLVRYLAAPAVPAPSASAPQPCAAEHPQESNHGFDGEQFALCALAAFLADAGNGVPIELVLGNGSFAFLGKAAASCAADRASNS